MYTISSLPKNYKAYEELEICSNLIKGGAILALIGELPPLLIGKGERPMIWLQAPTDFSYKNFLTLVEGSVATHSSVSVIGRGQKLTISIAGSEVLSITQINSNKAVIDHIDLSLVGFEIFGDDDGLRVGGASFSTSTFNGMGALVSMPMPT